MRHDEDAAERLRYLEAVDRITVAMSSTEDVDACVRAVADEMLEVFASDRVALVRAYFPSATSWVFMTLRSRDGEVSQSVPTRPIDEATAIVFQRVVDAGKSTTWALRSEAPALCDAIGARAILAIALFPASALPWILAVAVDPSRAPSAVVRNVFVETARRLGVACSTRLCVRKLRENEARLAEAARMAQLGFWENDLVADHVTWSEEAHRILGTDPNEGTPNIRSLQALTHPDDRARREDAVRRGQQDGRYDVIYRVIRPSGDVRTIHSVGSVAQDAKGRPVRAFGVVQDITDHRRVQEELALFRSLIDQTNDGIEIIDAESGRFLDVNEHACITHGYTRDEYLSLRVHDLDAEAGASWHRAITRLREHGPGVFETTHRRKDGSIFPVEVNVTLVRRDREYVLAVVRDISERKALEEQLRRAQKMEALGRLAGGVAHDFNNLLTVVNSSIEMTMQALPAGDPNLEMLDDAFSAGMRGATLTAQLLAFSRRQVLEPRVVAIDDVLGRLLHLLRRVIREDIELELRSNARGRVKVDVAQLEQAVVNLVVNARDAMPRGGRIVIETDDCEVTARSSRSPVLPGRWVRLRVRDTGHGIDAATRSRVFEPFFTTKAAGEGTGLGLAIVYGFVQQSGGQITLESEVDRGTTFTIHLPRTDAALTSTRPSLGSQHATQGTETVLVVEDEDSVRNVVKRVLEARGYRVLDARDGDNAMSVFRAYEGKIDVLVTDVVMPRMNGRQLAETLVHERPELRVLLMSGYTEAPSTPAAPEENAFAFLQKPFRPHDLARCVRRLLDTASAG